MEENKVDVIQRAKELLLESPIMRYGITEERIEEAFRNAHMMPTQEALLKEYNPLVRYDGRLDGFNRKHHCYFGPDATPHIVIHEMIHELFSEFDKDGHRIVNGIAKDNSYSQVLLNEGMTDYLASKISGENVLHYEREKIVFEKLEPMLVKQSGNPEVLFEIVSQDKSRINEFIESFAKPETADKLINNFQFLNKENINLAMDEIGKRFNRQHKLEQIKSSISSIFPRIKAIFNRRKALPPGSEQVKAPNESLEKNNLEADNELLEEQKELEQTPQRDKVKEFKKQYEYDVSYENIIAAQEEQQTEQNIDNKDISVQSLD